MRFTNIIRSIANGIARTSVAGVDMLRNSVLGQTISGTQEVQQMLDRMWLTRLFPLAGETSGMAMAFATVQFPGYLPAHKGKLPVYGERSQEQLACANPAISDVAGQSPRGLTASIALLLKRSGITRCQGIESHRFQKAVAGKS